MYIVIRFYLYDLFGFYLQPVWSVLREAEDDGVDLSMGEEKPEPLDFVKDFQEYLSQQTQHVNMISGSVIGVKDGDDLQGGTA